MLRPGSHSAFQLIPKVVDGSVWARTLPPHQTWQTVFFFFETWLSARRHCRVGRETVATKLEAHHCLKYYWMLS